MAAVMKIQVFCDAALCWLVQRSVLLSSSGLSTRSMLYG